MVNDRPSEMVPDRNDRLTARAFRWSKKDLEMVVKARGHYYALRREFGEGPGSPAIEAKERWYAAARVARKRAAKRHPELYSPGHMVPVTALAASPEMVGEAGYGLPENVALREAENQARGD